MIIYNITINVESSISEEWLTWMKHTHIPDVLKTNLFYSAKIFKLLTKQEDETGETYAVQYSCSSMENYENYQHNFAPKLQADSNLKFGGKYVAFRTLLEEVD